MVSLSTRQYRPSFRSGGEQTSIICSAQALGLINSIKVIDSTGDDVVCRSSKTIDMAEYGMQWIYLIAGLEDCKIVSLQTLLCLELPPV